MAGQYLIHEKQIAFFQETTVATPPASWSASGRSIEFISVDLGSVKEDQNVDPTAEERALAVGTRQRIPGRRNGTFSVVTKMHGTGVVTADGDTVTETDLGTLWKNAIGGLHLGTSHVITGGTATQPILDDVTGIIPGCMLAFEDTSSPVADYDGFPVCRRVLAISTLTLTLSEALPWTPAADDPVHACITAYPVAHTLRDAVAAGLTTSWYIREGDHESLNTRLDGCVFNAKIEGLSPGGLPTFTLEGMNANFAQGAADGLSDITNLPAPTGQPQLSMSLDVTLSIQEYGTTTVNLQHANSIAFETGIARSKVETATGILDRFHGLATYSFTPGSTKFTVTIPYHANTWHAGLKAGTSYRITLTQPGTGGGAGSGFCIHLPRARLIETPGKAPVGDNHGVTLAFEASEPSDTTGGSNVDLQKARFLVAMF